MKPKNCAIGDFPVSGIFGALRDHSGLPLVGNLRIHDTFNQSYIAFRFKKKILLGKLKIINSDLI